MRARQRGALMPLCTRFSDDALDFQVGRSVLLFALGVDVKPMDIDIVLPADTEAALRSAAGTWWRGQSAWRPGAVESEWMADLMVGDEAVEAMGGWDLWVGDRLHPVCIVLAPRGNSKNRGAIGSARPVAGAVSAAPAGPCRNAGSGV